MSGPVTVHQLLESLEQTRVDDLQRHFAELFKDHDPAATVQAVPMRDQLLLVVTPPEVT